MTTRNPTHNQGTPGLGIASDASGAASLRRGWLYAYVAVWIATLIPVVIVAGISGPLALAIRHWLKLTLNAQHNPPPSVLLILRLAAHNIPIAAWPLLLGTLGAQRHRLSRHAADAVLCVCIIANTLPVGCALGAYGTSLLAYVPQLPAEWSAIALGAGTWLVQREGRLTDLKRAVIAGLIVLVMVCSAGIETSLVPHKPAYPSYADRTITTFRLNVYLIASNRAERQNTDESTQTSNDTDF